MHQPASHAVVQVWRHSDACMLHQAACLYMRCACASPLDVSTASLQGASVGDIDADGELEVVVGTTSGKIYALSGKMGQDTGAFPFETRGRVMAPVRLPSGSPQLSKLKHIARKHLTFVSCMG